MEKKAEYLCVLCGPPCSPCSYFRIMYTTDELTKIIIEESIHIHRIIGPGMLENVYKTCLAYRLRKRKLFVEVEKPIPVIFEDVRMDIGYRADIVAERTIIIDTKNVEEIGNLHVAQMLTYLRFLNLRFGLILNFNSVVLKNGIRRVVNGF